MTKRCVVRTWFFLLIAGIGVSSAMAGDTLSGKVTAVPSADTVVLDYGHGSVEVRLVGVAVPPAFIDKARQFVKTKVLNKDAQMRFEYRGDDDHLVGHLLTDEPDAEPLDVGLQLIRLGLARWVNNFNDKYGDYAAADREARAEHRGLWSEK